MGPDQRQKSLFILCRPKTAPPAAISGAALLVRKFFHMRPEICLPNLTHWLVLHTGTLRNHSLSQHCALQSWDRLSRTGSCLHVCDAACHCHYNMDPHTASSSLCNLREVHEPLCAHCIICKMGDNY